MNPVSPPGGWSTDFKRKIVLYAMLGITPSMQVLSRLGLRTTIVLWLWIPALALILTACWYYWRHSPAPSDAPMSKREGWIFRSVVAVVVALMIYNAFLVFGTHPFSTNARY